MPDALQPATHDLAAYRRGCRCAICKAANAAYWRDYNARRRANGGAPLGGHGGRRRREPVALSAPATVQAPDLAPDLRALALAATLGDEQAEAKVMALADSRICSVADKFTWQKRITDEGRREDVRSEARLGALKALRRFDPNSGAHPFTWLAAKALFHLKDWWRENRSGGGFALGKLARRHDVPARFLAAPLDIHERSRNKGGGTSDDGYLIHEPIDPRAMQGIERLEATDELRAALRAIDPRVVIMLKARVGIPLTCAEVGRLAGISESRVVQLINATLHAIGGPATLGRALATEGRGSGRKHGTGGASGAKAASAAREVGAA